MASEMSVHFSDVLTAGLQQVGLEGFQPCEFRMLTDVDSVDERLDIVCLLTGPLAVIASSFGGFAVESLVQFHVARGDLHDSPQRDEILLQSSVVRWTSDDLHLPMPA